MSWARPSTPVLQVVLRAATLDAAWGISGKAGADATWQSAQWPLAAAPGSPAEPAPPGVISAAPSATASTAVLRAAVKTAFAQLRDRLGDGNSRLAQGARLTVLLAGPCAGVATLPWSDAMLDMMSTPQLARAELLAHGFDLGPVDAVQIDHRPPLGRPRAVFWVPGWLQAEIDALAAQVCASAVSVQALNLVAAAWAFDSNQRGRGAGPVIGILGSGSLQLWPEGDAAALGDTLAETSTDVELGPRVAALWQRACARSPSLAASAGLHVLSLDIAAPAAAGVKGGVGWWPWPAGATSRPALDRSLVEHAQARPVLPAQGTTPAPGRSPIVWTAWLALAGLALAAVLAGIGWQRQTEANRLEDQARVPVVTPRAPLPTAAESAEVRAVNAAVHQINLPLPALLRALRPPRDLPVVLLALELAARPGAAEGAGGAEARPDAASSVKLAAEASGSREMTRYIEFLGGRPGISSAQLVRHELDLATPGAPLRFEVELSWRR